MSKIVAVRKNSDGDLKEFKLDNGRIVSFKDAYDMGCTGEIEGIICTSGRDEALVIRSMPDGDPSNNLANLPTF